MLFIVPEGRETLAGGANPRIIDYFRIAPRRVRENRSPAPAGAESYFMAKPGGDAPG